MAKGDPSGQQGGMGYFPGIYQSALAQSAQDYDSIMSQYKDLASNQAGGNTAPVFNPISPSFANFEPGSDHSDLRTIAKTGGFSEGDVSNIRARGISPIKSIYSSAQQGLSRQKALSGGYSPNFGAASAKMARESSDLISKKTTDVNAGIAEMIQRGKLAASSTLAPLDARANEFKNMFEQNNANTANEMAKFNATAPLSFANFNEQQEENDFDRILKSIQGQQSTYGTTPALANTFGNQVLNAANTVGNLPPIRRNTGGGAVIGGSGSSGFRGIRAGR